MPERPVIFPTYFYRAGSGEPFYQEGTEPIVPLSIGDGVLAPDGMRYRVVDRWVSFDHRGHFDLGYHVFLEAVEEGSDDDRLGNAAPSYFRT